ncbi:hypothetical protein NX059_009605 [Plenodomus lindquistii]|nr:hypothetical protein NX059_009605 [Plenodomus lindquistii]
MGWLSLGMSLGPLLSPLLGGIVYDHAGYNAVFGMAYALIGVDVVLRLLLVEKKVAARWNPDAIERVALITRNVSDDTLVDVAGSTTLVGTLDVEKAVPRDACLANPNINSPPRQRLRDLLPPVLSLLFSRRLLASLFCALLQAAVMTAFASVIPIHAANIFNWTSTGAALLFLPLVIPTFVAPLFGWLGNKFGSR